MKAASLFLSCAGFVLAAATNAIAQVPIDQATKANAAPAESSPATATGETTVSTLVVTANKRAEPLQKTTASVLVTTGSDIIKSGKASIDDVLRDVPDVEISRSGGGNLFIRGIGSTSDTIDGRDMAVAITVDGVNQASGRILNSGVFDVERVEVVAGPQGTLYGRNATGGVINLVSVAPTFNFNARGSVQVGNYDEFRTEDAVNIPVSDTFAFRTAMFYEKHGGYGSYGINAVDNVGIRVRPLWDITDRLRLLGTFEYRHEGATPAQPYPLTALNYSDPWQHGYTGVAGVRDNSYFNAILQLDYDLGWSTFSVMPAYNRTKFYTQIPNPLPTEFPIPNFVAPPTSGINDQKTVEVHLASKASSPIKWIVGLYYLDLANDRTVEPPRLGVNPYCTPAICGPVLMLPPFSPGKNPATSRAAFGQVTYPITNRVRITGGLRYTEDTKKGNYTDSAGNTAMFSLPFHNLSFSTGLEYDVTKHSLAYLTVASGYKAGGANIPDQTFAAAKAITSFAPEKLIAYTVGMKNTLLGGRLLLNGEAYYYDYENLQYAATAAVPTVLGASQGVNCANVIVGPFTDPTSVCTNFSYTGNAPGSRAYGAQLMMNYQLTRSDNFHTTVDYERSQYGAFTYNVPGLGTVSLKGRRFIMAPTWAASVGYEHDFFLPNGGVIDARADARLSTWYNSSFDFLAFPAFRQPGYGKVDLSAGYTEPNKRWTVRGYVRNIGDVAVVESGSPLAVFLNDPRVFGVTLAANF